MQVFLVGGAIRDELLGLSVTERDWVVVGATPQAMLAQGYRAVGKDFPVFLHPKTKEEYALARTERKVAQGYKGFEFHYDKNVTLTEDLLRRDLTINAIAQDEDGALIDPYGGQQDLQDKWLRHVSPAFNEDPVRILRVARFAAKLPDFNVHPDTIEQMNTMVHNGEVNALVAERVWKEFARALECPAPSRFFEILSDCDALQSLWPEISKQAMDSLKEGAQFENDSVIRFAILTKSLTKTQVLSLCNRLRTPSQYSQLAMLVCEHQRLYDELNLNNAKSLLNLVKTIDAQRRPQRLPPFCHACDFTQPNELKRKLSLLTQCITEIKSIDTHYLQTQNLSGQQFAQALEQMQLTALSNMLHNKKP